MNIYIHIFIIVLLTSMMDVFNFRLRYTWKYAFRKNGWDAFHLTKWILISYLVVIQYINEYGFVLLKFGDIGLMFMWLTIIIVGLHYIILHKIFK